MLLMSYVIGSIIAYPLFDWLNSPEDHPFHKLARHSTLLCGMVFSFVLVWSLNLHKQNLFGFGIGFTHFFKQLLRGLLIGSLILLAVELILILLSIHVIDSEISISFSFISILLLKGLITGIIVGFLEEILFRGTIYKSIEKRYSIIIVISITAVIYAAVHFIKYPVLGTNSTVNWFTGPSLLPEAFQSLFSIAIWDTFLTLFLLGVLLAIFRVKYDSIAYCIGIHAGIVMMLKASRKLTNFNPETDFGFLVNNTDQQLGLLASIILGLCCWYYYFKLKPGTKV